MLGLSKGKHEKAIFTFVYEKARQIQEEKERVEKQMREDEDEGNKKRIANLIAMQQK